MKSVILVSMEYPRPQDGKYGLGISSIAAALEDAGVSWRIIDAQINSPDFSLANVRDELFQAIEEVGEGCLVGFSTYVWNDLEVCNLIRQLRGAGVEIVLGGPQISNTPKGQLEDLYPDADYFVRGHGEMAMVGLASEILPDNSGIHVAGEPDLGVKVELELLDLPSPYLLGTAEIRESIRWETQRGCPYECSFCQHRELGKWQKDRCFFGEQRLERELALFATAGVKRISVLDPVFHVDQTRTIRILNSIKTAGVGAQISLQCRFEACTPQFLDALEGLNVTLEFGLQTIIEGEYRSIGRPNSMKKVSSVIRELHERQIDFEVSLIYGLPKQTLKSFLESVDWCKQQKIPRIRAWPLMLLRGTPLYEQKERYGFKESSDQPIPIVVSSNTFSEEDHVEMARIARELEEN
ncbi:B12-binding domain-containing radical SAM protein [Sedimenticola thiotaurini]|nr:B12-binding domain-containing radical SAM protein [Sedimenticola thiotaurini]